MRMKMSKTAVVTRGTFGFVRFSDEDAKHPAIVEHVFSDGRLGVHYSGNKGFYAVITPDIFSPSKDAYFCEGSYVEPMWEADSCCCTNYWVKEDCRLEGTELVKFNPNCATNIMTDEEALKTHGPFVEERRIAGNVSLSEAKPAATPRVGASRMDSLRGGVLWQHR